MLIHVYNQGNFGMFYKRNVLIAVFLYWGIPIASAQDAHTQVSSQINSSDYTEYAPTVSADGKSLFFEGNKEGAWRIYESRYAEGAWSEPKSIEAVNNYGSSNDLIGGPSISYDGNTLYFFASFSESLGREDIYYSVREGEAWSEPINIGSPINTEDYEGFPSISADGQKLYFIRENPESDIQKKSKGQLLCYTIFVSERDAQGNWQKPKPLPAPINLDCERAPRILSDNRTLIFSSVREGGMGNFDLYLSKSNAVGDWSTPLHMDFASTEGSDQFASVSASGDILYHFHNGDIQTVTIPEELRQSMNITIQGYISDLDSKKGVASTLNISDARTTEQVMQLESNSSDGRFTAVLSEGREYNIEVQAPGYSYYNFNFDLSQLDKYQEFNRDIQLFQQVDLLVSVQDLELYEPVSSDVHVFLKGSDQELSELSGRAENGRIHLNLPIGEVYDVRISAENFQDTSFVYDLSSYVKYRNYEKDIELRPTKVDFAISISDLETNESLPVEVVLINKNRDETIVLKPEDLTRGDNGYSIKIRQGDEYDVEVKTPKGYAFFEDNTIQEEGKKNQKNRRRLDLKLTPLKPNTKLELYNITFESGSSELNDNSVRELNRILALLIDNPNIKIEVAAHTDSKSSARYNMALSRKRAQSVYDFLVAESVDPSRLEAKGYGEEKPLVPNDSPENMAKNRRFELIILSL